MQEGYEEQRGVSLESGVRGFRVNSHMERLLDQQMQAK